MRGRRRGFLYKKKKVSLSIGIGNVRMKIDLEMEDEREGRFTVHGSFASWLSRHTDNRERVY